MPPAAGARIRRGGTGVPDGVAPSDAVVPTGFSVTVIRTFSGRVPVRNGFESSYAFTTLGVVFSGLATHTRRYSERTLVFSGDAGSSSIVHSSSLAASSSVIGAERFTWRRVFRSDPVTSHQSFAP